MSKMKKLGALLFALVLILSIGVPTYAADGDMDGKSGIIGAFASADTPDAAYTTNLILYKELVVYNADGLAVCAPTIDYDYTIAAVAGGATVKDIGTGVHSGNTPVQVVTKTATGTPKIYGSVDGGTNYVDGKLALTTAVDLTSASGGSSNKFKLKADFSGVTWAEGAGVYRFLITETTTTAGKNAAGIADGTITNTRYVDVYVKDATTPGTYEVYGYTCFMNAGNIDGTTAASVTAASKTEGFVAGSNNGTAQTADQYYTFNLLVSKTLTGDTAKNDNKFPFTVKLTNSSVTADIKLKVKTVEDGAAAVDGTAVTGTLSTASTGITATPTIDHQSNIKYIGIPVGITAGTAVDVKETNNVAGTTYTSTYSIDNAAAAGEKNIYYNEDSNSAQFTETMNAADATSHTVAFTNALKLISPTGVVLRVAPYAIMLGMGILLLIVVRRRRPEEEAMYA